MGNISGNFNTANKEHTVIADFLAKLGIDATKCTISKFGQTPDGKDTNAKSAGDIYVGFEDKTFLLFEVKEERLQRIERYNQLGIDFISVFQYKPGQDQGTGIRKPYQYDSFVNAIDIEHPRFKWGKLAYSLSDVWVFYCKNPDGTYRFIDGYDYRKIVADNLFEYCQKHCDFAINNKSADQMSHSDTWKSAVFYVDRKHMEKYKIESIYDLYHGGDNFTDKAFLKKNK